MRRKPWILLLVVALLTGFAGTGQADVLFTTGASGTASNLANLLGTPDGIYARFNNTDYADVTFGPNFGDGIFLDVGVVIEVSLLDAALLLNLDLFAHRTTGEFDALNGYGLYEIGGLFASGYQYDYLRLAYDGGLAFLDVDAVAVKYGAVPEPSTLLLLGSGLLGLVGYGRRMLKK